MPLISNKVREVGATLGELKDRVRIALAGELARIIADAIKDVLQVVLRREPEGTGRNLATYGVLLFRRNLAGSGRSLGRRTGFVGRDSVSGQRFRTVFDG